MGRTLILAEVKEAAKQLDPLRRNPENCVYTDRDGSHCVAGQVLVDLGLPVPQWDETTPSHDDPNECTLDGAKVQSWFADRDIDFESDALEWLTALQDLADGRGVLPTESTWGDCVVVMERET